MRDAAPDARRHGRWLLVGLLLTAAAVSAIAAALAGGAVPEAASTFGPALATAGGTSVPSSAAPGAAEVVHAARVVAPSAVAAAGVGAAGVGAAAAPVAPVGPAYRVDAPFRPTGIVLPGALSAPVSPVGLQDDGSLVIPDDPRVVGWWTGGSMAGETYGSTVLAGHVDSASRGVGVLAALTRLRSGQVVELTGARSRARYDVVSARLVPQASLSHLSSLFRRDGEAQLVLITCGGPFDPVRRRYADNYVVVARPAT